MGCFTRDDLPEGTNLRYVHMCRQWCTVTVELKRLTTILIRTSVVQAIRQHRTGRVNDT